MKSYIFDYHHYHAGAIVAHKNTPIKFTMLPFCIPSIFLFLNLLHCNCFSFSHNFFFFIFACKLWNKKQKPNYDILVIQARNGTEEFFSILKFTHIRNCNRHTNEKKRRRYLHAFQCFLQEILQLVHLNIVCCVCFFKFKSPLGVRIHLFSSN